jgi:hypothetical protein
MAWDFTKSAPSAQCPNPGGNRRAETRRHRIASIRLREDAQQPDIIAAGGPHKKIYVAGEAGMAVKGDGVSANNDVLTSALSRTDPVALAKTDPGEDQRSASRR